MLAHHYRSFKGSLDEQGIIFSFSGYLSEAILYSLGDALRQKMAVDDTDVNTIKKVFSVFVEQAQNIIHYSSDKVRGPGKTAAELSSGLVIIGRERGHFFIVCANVMRTVDVPRLRPRLEHLRNLAPDQIKAYYKEQLREAPEDGSRGATIGLIEIARRASQPIDFDFEDLDEGHTFFCMRVAI